MLSVEENELLTRVGAGTPMGELLRRYWHPIAAVPELHENPTKAVRLLGEDLVLYRDNGGRLGLIDESCPHRRVNMLYGLPDDRGLRRPYHGWLFDEPGACLDMPMEPPVCPLAQRTRTKPPPFADLGDLMCAVLKFNVEGEWSHLFKLHDFMD